MGDAFVFVSSRAYSGGMKRRLSVAACFVVFAVVAIVFCILCRCRKTGLPEDSHEVIEENEMNKVKVEGEEDVAEQVVAEHHFKGKPGAGPVVVASCPG